MDTPGVAGCSSSGNRRNGCAANLVKDLPPRTAKYRTVLYYARLGYAWSCAARVRISTEVKQVVKYIPLCVHE